MASSSVSQDDIDNDFEKNSRRSRIRTARARQINPSGCRMESSQVLDPDREQHVEVEDQNGSGISTGNYSANGKVSIILFLLESNQSKNVNAQLLSKTDSPP